MPQLTVNTFMSVDGVMQAPGGPEEDPSGGFSHGGWSVNYWDDAMGEVMGAVMGKPFQLLLGRKTYEIFAAHWPYITNDLAADALNNASKHVASRTLSEVQWAGSTLIEGEVQDYVADLKNQDGPEIQVHGSADLLQTLIEHDLVDLYRLWVFPLVLGKGKRLFADGAIPAGLKLIDSKTSTSGVIIAEYERSGDIETGSFALDEPTDAEIERRARASASH